MSTEVVKLGLMPPLSGLVGIYGSEISHAGQVACQEVNDNGGVLGRPLELVIEDDGSLPESSVVAAEKLIDHHRCSAIIGNLLSNSRIAVAYRVAEPRKIPYLNFSFYEGSILSRYFFHYAALPNQQIHKMIPYMRYKFGPRMFFAGNNYEWPRGSIDAGKLALLKAGGEVLGEEYFSIDVEESDIEQLLDHVEAAAPDVFVPYFAGADQVLLLTRFTQRGLKDKIAVVMGHYDEMMASQLSPEVREGFYSSNTYFMTVDTEKNREYLSRLAKLPTVNGIWPNGNGILTNFGEGTYICVKAFAEAANKAGSLEPEALVAVLRDLSIDAPQGKVLMNPEHHHARVNTYLSRCDRDGVFHIVDSFGAIDPVIPERYNHQRISHQATVEDDIRLQARMLEQMSEGVLLVSTNDQAIIFANVGAEKMFGYNKSEMIGLAIESLHGPVTQDVNYSFATIINTLNQQGEWQGESSNQKKDGSFAWCSINVSTFTHPVYGEVWLWVATDITELKKVETELKHHRIHLEELVEERTAELRQARDDAKRASQAKSIFLSRMSHELRTPMNAILGFAQLLEMAKIGHENNEFVGEILGAGNHLLELIDELLDLSRIEAGKMVIVKQAINVKSAVNDVVQITKPLLENEKITLKNQCKKDDTVIADPTRLIQILINLISNAAKYNLAGGSITIATGPGKTGYLRLSISDSGIGISQENIKKLFNPFERLGAEFGAVEGTGIGLALSKQLVELMAGDISVESIEGKGSVFSIELPLSAQYEVNPEKDNAQAIMKEGKYTILYVEDNAANMRVAEAIFKRYPHVKLLSANNGEYGLDLANKYKPDMVLLDIHLPGMDGYDILNKLKSNADTCDIDVVALSAAAMPFEIEKGLQAGFRHYLTKPLKVDLLIQTVSEILEEKDSGLAKGKFSETSGDLLQKPVI